MSYAQRYAALQEAVNTALAVQMDICGAPEPLLSAMRYSLLAGGKRLRPVLLLAACEACGGDVAEAMPFACALEMVHTYSLIHDDLPAMDDDDLRRGRPTNHRVYGEGMAVLAGDGLLNLAFEAMLAATEGPARVAAMRRIAGAAGARGMIGGQCVDLDCEAKDAGGPAEIAYIHRHKTAALFIGAVAAGMLLAGADAQTVAIGEAYATALGEAFQIRDDLLDIEGDAQALGKATGMDAARGKLTWPGVFGVETAREAVRSRTRTALEAAQALGGQGDFLRDMALWLLERDR